MYLHIIFSVTYNTPHHSFAPGPYWPLGQARIQKIPLLQVTVLVLHTYFMCVCVSVCMQVCGRIFVRLSSR